MIDPIDPRRCSLLVGGLMGLSLLSILLVGVLLFQSNSFFESSLQAQSLAAETFGHSVRFGHILSDMSAPANDIFQGGDIKGQRQKSAEAQEHYSVFKKEMIAAQNSKVPMNDFLREVEPKVERLIFESNETIEFFEERKLSKAAAAMSAMDAVDRSIRVDLIKFQEQLLALGLLDVKRTEKIFSILLGIAIVFFTLLTIVSAFAYLLGFVYLGRLRKYKDINSFYRVAIDQSSIVATTDSLGVITYVNEAFEKISGYKSDELIGSTHKMINSGQMPIGFFKNLWADISQGKIWRGEICNRAKNGSLYWVDTVIVPFTDRKGKIVQYMSIRTEITNRKLLENEVWKSNQLKRLMLDAVSYAVISTDRDGVIQVFSKSAETLLGFTADELTGASPTKFHDRAEIEARGALLSYEINQTFANDFEILVGKARLGEIDENEWTYLDKHGTRIPVSVSVATLKDQDEKAIGYLFIARDISLQKKMYEDLLAANREMKRLSNVKSQFVANMSHEIRTPMNAVIGMCDLLLDDVHDIDLQKKIMVIKESGESLLTLVNDTLDLSKIESGRLEFEARHFDPCKVAKDLVELFKGRASEKGNCIACEVAMSVPPLVLGDEFRFRQVLSNIISNAIKFTSCGRIDVKMSGEALDSNRYRINVVVADTGIGIKNENLDKIFVPFSQEDNSTTRRFGGTGLGLSICKNLCQGMGGDIFVASEFQKGTTMSFHVVFQGPDAEYILAPKVEPRPLKGNLRILIAEDNKVNQIVVTGLLRKLKYDAVLVENGQQVLNILEKKEFDLIFMDCHMPEMDGFEATKQIIRRFQGRKRPHIVALTASAMKTDIEKCFSVGMGDFIAKPVSASALADVIRKVESKEEQKPIEIPPLMKHIPREIAEARSSPEKVKYRSIKTFNQIVSLAEKGELQVASGILSEMDSYEKECIGDCISMLQTGLGNIEKLNQILGVLGETLSELRALDNGSSKQ